MITEKAFFIECLRDYCHVSKTPGPRSDINWDVFLEMIDSQDLQAIFFEQFRDWPKQNEKLRSAFLNTVAVSVNRKDLLGEIVDRFKKEDISLICMKGSVFRDYYPVPELRTMGDIDFIIYTKDREKTNRILVDDMHFNRMIDNHAVWTYWTGQFMFEVHDHMFYENLAVSIDYRQYFDHIWEHIKHGTVFGIQSDNLFIPEDSFHFLYLMTHTAKHVINKGMGFRAFLDMVFMCRKCANVLDWPWIIEQLETLHLLEFTRTCFALCEHWFDVKMPISTPQLSPDFLKAVTEKMFQDGLFGIENPDNETANSAKEISRAVSSYGVTAMLLTIRRLFPSYDNMQLTPWYSFVNGRPWLLPAAWIYRWGYCLTHKRKEGVSLLTEPFLKRSQIEDRERYLKKWGLK